MFRKNSTERMGLYAIGTVLIFMFALVATMIFTTEYVFIDKKVAEVESLRGQWDEACADPALMVQYQVNVAEANRRLFAAKERRREGGWFFHLIHSEKWESVELLNMPGAPCPVGS